MKRLIVAIASILAWTATQVAAADFDGTKLLICANVEAADCGAGQACPSSRKASRRARPASRVWLAQRVCRRQPRG